jgi:hypothetical protein
MTIFFIALTHGHKAGNEGGVTPLSAAIETMLAQTERPLRSATAGEGPEHE